MSTKIGSTSLSGCQTAHLRPDRALADNYTLGGITLRAETRWVHSMPLWPKYDTLQQVQVDNIMITFEEIQSGSWIMKMSFSAPHIKLRQKQWGHTHRHTHRHSPSYMCSVFSVYGWLLTQRISSHVSADVWSINGGEDKPTLTGSEHWGCLAYPPPYFPWHLQQTSVDSRSVNAPWASGLKQHLMVAETHPLECVDVTLPLPPLPSPTQPYPTPTTTTTPC